MVIILHYVLCTTTRSVKSAASIFVCINEFNLNLNRVIACMKTGTLYEIIKAGLICVHYRNELFPQKDKGVLCILKSFFLPLFFIRDYGLGIIRPSKVRLNAPGKMQ